MKLLVIEDERSLRENIVHFLTGNGYICESCGTLQAATDKLADYDYDCVLLDLGLPDGEGLAVLNYLQRRMKGESVIIISARNSLDDRLKGLDIGADDYMTKPFHFAELKSRLTAIYRRKNANSNNRLIFNEISIDLHGHNVEINGAPVALTRTEYEMLLYFIVNKGRVISKTAIAEHLWGDEMDINDNFDFLYTHVKNLRKKLADAFCTEYLTSVYGIGYKFTA